MWRALLLNPTKQISLQSMQIEVYDRLEQLDDLRSDWDALLAEFPHATTFSTLEWLIPWWRAFAGDSRLRILAARDESRSLVGLAPLALISRRSFGTDLRLLRLMGDGSHDSDNLDLPVRPGYEAEISRVLIDWLEFHRSDWDVCQFRTLLSDSPMGGQLREDLRARGWKLSLSTRPGCVVDLGETWDSYLKRLSSKERGKIGLRSRRLEKKYADLKIRKCATPAELEVSLKALFDLHGKHWNLHGLPGTLYSPARRQFYGELAQSLLARERLEFWILEVDGKITATQFGLRHTDTVFSLQEGFDPDYSSDSVGYVLRSQVLKNLIADGIRKYDFLGGADDSKVRWGAEVRSYVNLEFARPRTLGSFHLSARDKSAETKEWLRQRLPASVWQTLKRLTGRSAS
jgi:CelD/BcsL family acetyltransferase involved in cellulose biosynthesis